VFKVKDSVQAGVEWNGGEIDLLYLDSHHSYEHVYSELKAWIPHLSDKGVVLGHDVNPLYWHDMYKTGGVDRAFREFSAENGWVYLRLMHKPGLGILYRRWGL